MVEIIQTLRYKSEDGSIYDTHAQAVAADRAYAGKVGFWVDRIIKILENAARYEIERHKDRKSFPKLIIFKSKHEDLYYYAFSADDLEKIGFDILTMNLEDGLYTNSDKDEATATTIEKTNNKLAAFGFICDRKDYQYEEWKYANFISLK